MRFTKADSERFNKALKLSKRLEFLTVYTDEEPDKSDLYIATGGGVGLAISPDKELLNLFNNTGTKLCGREAVDFAISKGARKVFYLDGFLHAYYRHFGFVEVDRSAWDDSLRPAKWDYKRYGRPDVVWAELPVDCHE